LGISAHQDPESCPFQTLTKENCPVKNSTQVKI
jgi:hypothetical protein